MNVTHLNSYFFTNKLHAELVRKLADYLQAQHVFLPLPNGKTKKPPKCSGVSFSLVKCFSKLDRILWPLKMFNIWKAYELDRKAIPVDLNHAHTLFVNGLVAYWAKRKYGIPYIVTIRNTDVNHFLKKVPIFFRPIGLRIMRESEAVITISHVYWDQHMRSLLEALDFEDLSRKHYTIPNGCADFWFEESRIRRDIGSCLRLVFVGVLDKNKNLRVVLQVCKILSEMGVAYDLKVVGNGPLENTFRVEAKGLPVRFLGYVKDRRELRKIYEDSDVLVVPSRTETFGVVYTEAMTQGLPVIYTAGQGFDGFFPDGVVGFAVDPNSAAEIADRIVSIRNAYCQFAKRVAESASRFRWDQSVNELLGVYNHSAKPEERQ